MWPSIPDCGEMIALRRSGHGISTTSSESRRQKVPWNDAAFNEPLWGRLQCREPSLVVVDSTDRCDICLACISTKFTVIRMRSPSRRLDSGREVGYIFELANSMRVSSCTSCQQLANNFGHVRREPVQCACSECVETINFLLEGVTVVLFGSKDHEFLKEQLLHTPRHNTYLDLEPHG